MASEKQAVLAFWDPEVRETVELTVTWNSGFDKDAKISVPSRYRKLWDEAVRLLEWDLADGRPKSDHEPVAPYPALPWSVPLAKLQSSATGFFAIMSTITGFWPGSSIGWSVHPPYRNDEAAVGTALVEGDEVRE